MTQNISQTIQSLHDQLLAGKQDGDPSVPMESIERMLRTFRLVGTFTRIGDRVEYDPCLAHDTAVRGYDGVTFRDGEQADAFLAYLEQILEELEFDQIEAIVIRPKQGSLVQSG